MRSWLCPLVWAFFKQIDCQKALQVKKSGCRLCKGILDWASFPRKPRGLEYLGGERRMSFCCRDCRKRVTPDSVRFLWKKVYVLLAVALEPERRIIGVCRRTVARWRQFWSDQLSVRSEFCAHFRYLLPVGFSFSCQSMLSSFSSGSDIQFALLARFLSPLGCAPWLRFHCFRAEDAS